MFKKWMFLFLAGAMAMGASAQAGKGNKTLLWKVSGNGLEKPSYIFGTIHMLCADDAVLSENMKQAIQQADEVYFEVDMDNLFEMLGVMSKMKMKGDTTLRDLLSETDYQKVKKYFSTHSSMLPFSMLETYKPILAASTLESNAMPCDESAMMEQIIMEEAKLHDKKISGLETMSFQAGLLDSIPYKIQAQELVNYVEKSGKSDKDDDQMKDMFKAYNEQDLSRLEKMMVETDPGMMAFTDILLYHRNEKWVTKLKTIMAAKSVVVAVGAGHLPGDRGVLNLLRKAGYTVSPVENVLHKTKVI